MDTLARHALAVTGVLDGQTCGRRRTHPELARRFAEVTFTSDNREDPADVSLPTLVLQSKVDMIAPQSAGEYLRDHLKDVTAMAPFVRAT